MERRLAKTPRPPKQKIQTTARLAEQLEATRSVIGIEWRSVEVGGSRVVEGSQLWRRDAQIHA